MYLLWRHPTHCCVEREFAYWDAHSKGTQVTQTKDSLSICYNYCLKREISYF